MEKNNMTFSDIAKNVIRARENFSAPEAFKLRERADTSTMAGKKITIDEIYVVSKVKYDSETKEPILKKDGTPVFQQYVYVGFDKDKFFQTKSMILLEQLEMLYGQTLKVNEVKEIKVNIPENTPVVVGTEKVRYADKKLYDQIIFKDN